MPGNLKITAGEKEFLVGRHGTVSSGLRAALDAFLADQALASAPASGMQDALLGTDTLVEAPAVPHRHRKGKMLGTNYDMGSPVNVYRCTDPNCTVTLTD